VSGGLAGLAIGAGVKALAAKAAGNARRDVAGIRTWWRELQPSTRKWIVRGLLIIAGYFIHQHYAHKAIDRAKLEQKAADDKAFAGKLADVAKRAAEISTKAEGVARSIADLERTRHEETVRHNAADAALLMRGAGAAASHCRPVSNSAPSTGTGGYVSSAPVSDAAGSQVPAGDWALVPWDWLVLRAQEHDDLLSRAVTVNRNDKLQRDAWEKMRAGGVTKP
jgi:hypothetical protein